MKVNYYQAKKIAKAVIYELQTLKKSLTQGQISKLKDTIFDFNNSCGCIYGTLFKQNFSDSAHEFKHKYLLSWHFEKLDNKFLNKAILGVDDDTLLTPLEVAFIEDEDHQVTNEIVQQALNSTAPNWNEIENSVYKIVLKNYRKY